MRDCWHPTPSRRPSFYEIVRSLRSIYAANAAIITLSPPEMFVQPQAPKLVMQQLLSLTSASLAQTTTTEEIEDTSSLYAVSLLVVVVPVVVSDDNNMNRTQVWAGCSNGSVQVFHEVWTAKKAIFFPTSSYLFYI